MKLIEQSAERIDQGYYIPDLIKHIELCSRVCYKSEDRITEGSAEKLVNSLIKSKHYAMLEHGTVYLKFTYASPIADADYIIKSHICLKYSKNPYSECVINCKDGFHTECYITTNYRVIIENGWQSDLQYICEPTEFHKKRITLKFVTSIGIVRELVRHRKFSFANESTRYCNYSKDKFNSEITFIKPSWYDEATPQQQCDFKNICDVSEFYYNRFIQHGFQAQQAREALTVSTKSEIIMTGFEDDWQHVLDLRLRGTTGAPHPDMKILAEKIDKLIN